MKKLLFSMILLSGCAYAACPSSAEVTDAIKLYQQGGIIRKIEPKLNMVYITTQAQNRLTIDEMKVLGYLAACYSGDIKGNNLNWVEIYNYNTGKKVAKYSENWGFKMY